MKLLQRLRTYLDGQTTPQARRLELAFPRVAQSPDQVVARFLPSRLHVESIGSFPCCRGCCDHATPEVHRGPCSHQSDLA